MVSALKGPVVVVLPPQLPAEGAYPAIKRFVCRSAGILHRIFPGLCTGHCIYHAVSLKHLLIQHGFGELRLESGDFRCLTSCTAIPLTPSPKSGIRNGVLATEFAGGCPGFGLAENTDALFVGKMLLRGDVLMWLMKILLTSGHTN